MFILEPHEWHPIFVHFTVASTTIATVLFALSYIQKKGRWHDESFIVSHWSLWLGALVTILTIITGYVAFDSVTHDMPSHIAMTNHKHWALVTGVVLGIVAIWSFIRHLKYKTDGIAFLFALIICSILVSITAYKGGELVYGYGLGVESMPGIMKSYHQSMHDKKNIESNRDNIFTLD